MYRDEYPQYKWMKKDDYEEYYLGEINEQLSVAGYTAVNELTLKKLENKAIAYDKLRKQNTQRKIAENIQPKQGEPKQIIPVEEAKSDNHLDLLLTDLIRKILICMGEPGHGKTVTVKDLVYHAKQHGWIVKIFDISLAWRYNAPVEHYQKVVNPELYRNMDDCIYDIAMLSPNERRELIASIIKQDWIIRYLGIDADPDYLSYEPQTLYIFEEGNSYFDSYSLNRKDAAGAILTDFISARRNYKQSAVIVATAVSGEVATKFRRRCNFLSGKIMGEEERRYLKNGTSRGFMEKASILGLREFIYYGSREIKQPFSFTYRDYPTPEITEVKLDEPTVIVEEEDNVVVDEPKKGIPLIWWILFLLVSGTLFLVIQGMHNVSSGVSL